MAKRNLARLTAVLCLLAIAACATSNQSPPALPAQFSSTPEVASPETLSEGYRIGPLDRVSINVYQVKDLTMENVQVDSGGRLLLPLIGSVTAAGKTAPELSAEIADRLRGRYLQAPQVAVWVSEILSQRVTVDGSVVQPGVYPLTGPTTLIQAVSMAKGPDMKLANLSRVVVFRTVGGERSVAVFDLKKIRKGTAPDPEIRGNDIVVVDGSQLKGAWREIIGALPGLAIFRPY